MELSDAADWYAKDSIRNGQRFLSAFRSLVTDIMHMPERFPPARGGTRKARMKRYPYSIIFAVEPEQVVILVVAHARRRPDYWHDRVSGS